MTSVCRICRSSRDEHTIIKVCSCGVAHPSCLDASRTNVDVESGFWQCSAPACKDMYNINEKVPAPTCLQLLCHDLFAVIYTIPWSIWLLFQLLTLLTIQFFAVVFLNAYFSVFTAILLAMHLIYGSLGFLVHRGVLSTNYPYPVNNYSRFEVIGNYTGLPSKTEDSTPVDRIEPKHWIVHFFHRCVDRALYPARCCWVGMIYAANRIAVTWVRRWQHAILRRKLAFHPLQSISILKEDEEA